MNLFIFFILTAFALARGQKACKAFDGGIDMCEYETHEELIERLRQLERKYPGLAQVGSVGKSVKGREMVYIKIRSVSLMV